MNVNKLKTEVFLALTLALAACEGSDSTSNDDETLVSNNDNNSQTTTPNSAAQFSGDLAVNVPIDIESVSGQVAITDSEQGEAQLLTTASAEYGTFAISSSGHWQYSINSEHSVFNGWSSSADQATDVITLTSIDGTTTNLLITINGIDTDIETLYSENFNNGKSGKWSHANVEVDSNHIRIKYPLYKNFDTGRVGSHPMMVGQIPMDGTASEATFKYRIKLDDNYDTNMGGKFFGIGPAVPITGCKDITNYGWSARIGIRDKHPQLYLYRQGKPNGQCGEIIRAEEVTLEKNRWYDLAIYVKLNSSGLTNDAEARLYVDGVEVANKTEFQFFGGTSTDVPDTAQIQRIIRTTFLGSMPSISSGESKTGEVSAVYDDFKVVQGNQP